MLSSKLSIRADTGQWNASPSLPETYVVFRGNAPTTLPYVTVFCADRIAVFGIGFVYAEELAVSDVLESPEAILTLAEHPL